MHYKTQLRHGVRDALDQNVEGFGGRVFSARVWPYLEEDAPVINVETGKELSENDDLAADPVLQLRKLDLAVTVFDVVTEDFVDRLEAHQLLVERVMGRPELFGVKLINFEFVAAVPVKTEAIDVEGKDGAVLAGITLHFIATVSVAEGAPDEPLYGVF